MKSFMDRIRLGEIKIDEELWGHGAEPIILDFLKTEYDEKTMPTLACADVKGREGVWLLGWEDEGTNWPNLLVYLFGESYRDEQMFRIRMRKQLPGEGEGRFGFGHHRVRPEGTA
jgi:hypothetical protein